MVARHGVTTAIVQTWQAHQSGSRAIAVKTAGATRDERLVDALAAVKHYWRGPFDPLVTEERYRNELRRGKDYADKPSPRARTLEGSSIYEALYR